MTDLAVVPTIAARNATGRVLPTLAVGLGGGCALGAVARMWMRLIAVHPEFTWNGTLFIVVGFTTFGLTQSIVAVARRRAARRWTLTVVRAIGAMAMLPLFVAAGAVMLPTVVGGGLALTRIEWRRVTRALCLVVAAGPVLFVGSDLVDKFGWSRRSVAGFVAMFAIYATIIGATRFTFTAQADGWRMPRWATITTSAIVGLLFLVPLIGGGIK